MTDHMSNSKYVQASRREAVRVCSGILEGRVDVLNGCHHLSALQFEVGVDDWDPDFKVFVGISAECVVPPGQPARRYWSAEEVERFEPDINDPVGWAMALVGAPCRSVVKRFSADMGR